MNMFSHIGIRKALFVGFFSTSLLFSGAIVAPTRGAAEPQARANVKTAEANMKTEPTERARTEAELRAWAKPVLGELATSGNDVDRALGYGLQLLLAAAEMDAKAGPSGVTGRSALADLQQAQSERIRQEVLSARTSVPAKMLYLKILCSPQLQANARSDCADVLALDPFKNADANNAYLIIYKLSLQADAQKAQRYEKAREQNSLEQFKTEAGRKALDKLRTAQSAEASKNAIKALSVGTRFDDYGLIYKERVRRLLKARPLPDAVLQRLGPQFLMIAKFFPQEDMVAWIAGSGLVVVLAEGSSVFRLLEGDARQATSKRLFELAIANPQTSATSLEMFNPPQDHAFVKSFQKYKSIDKKKNFSVDLLLSVNWTGFRPVLAKAISRGDLAALPDAMRWVDAELDKVPNKTDIEVAAEKTAQGARQAQYQARQDAYEKAISAISAGCTEEANSLKKAGKVTDLKKLGAMREKCTNDGARDALKRVYQDPVDNQLAPTTSKGESENAKQDLPKAAGE
jgi:hypothetical protein